MEACMFLFGAVFGSVISWGVWTIKYDPPRMPDQEALKRLRRLQLHRKANRR